MLKRKKDLIIEADAEEISSADVIEKLYTRNNNDSKNDSVGIIKAKTGFFLVLRNTFRITSAIAAATAVIKAGKE